MVQLRVPRFRPSLIALALVVLPNVLVLANKNLPNDYKRVWMPSRGEAQFETADRARSASACFNAMTSGGTLLAQCGGPTATQIAALPSDGDLVPGGFVGIQDHSVVLEDHAGNRAQWAQDFSGMSTTNFAACMEGTVSGDGPQAGCSFDDRYFTAQSYSTRLGGQVNPSGPPPRSMLNLGYTSYFVQQETVDFSVNTFFVMLPGASYWLPGCATYAVGQTGAEECPVVKKKDGEFKFSVVGLLSGATINRLHTSSPPSTRNDLATNAVNDRDIADYKTMIYRTTLDVGAMGAAADVKMWVTGTSSPALEGKNFSDIAATDDLGGSVLHFFSAKAGEVTISFAPTYSTGRFARSKADVVAEFGSFPCTGQMDDCSRDVSGFGKPPTSLAKFSNGGVKKMGQKSGWPGNKASIAAMAGAPALTVSEVKNMKMFLKPAACSGRPRAPAGRDKNGLGGTAWPGAPQDCPWWYTATDHTGAKWAVDKGSSACAGGTEETCTDDDLVQDNMIQCIAGQCFIVEFHFDLGGQTEASRTLLGNPENAATHGWEKGVFFIYDPTVATSGKPFFDWVLVIGLSVGGTILLCLCVFFCVRCCKKKKGSRVVMDGSDLASVKPTA